MDKFKIRGGDFIGIIIPGIYLVFNIILPFSSNAASIPEFLKESKLNEEIGIFFLFLVVSYITGSALRLLSTDIPDRFSVYLRLLCITIIGKIKKIFIKRKKNEKSMNPSLAGYKEKFPYLEWYTGTCLTGMPKTSKQFFKSFFIEFNSLLKSKKKYHHNYKYFFNNCKVEIINSSQSLGEEVLNAEGLSRMAMGMFYASLSSCLIILIKNIFLIISYIDNLQAICISKYYFVLFLSNFILLLIFTWGVHQVRVKESAIVFTSISIIKSKK